MVNAEGRDGSKLGPRFLTAQTEPQSLVVVWREEDEGIFKVEADRRW